MAIVSLLHTFFRRVLRSGYISMLLLYCTSFASERPNIVLFMTDDQDVSLGSMSVMPQTLARFRDAQGAVSFKHGYVSTPLCCPSRSSILSGRYVHTHQVYTNGVNCSSQRWIDEYESNSTMGILMQRAGYRTGYFGKYLNDYDGRRVPAGWRVWAGQVRNSRYYNYSLNFNGDVRWHGANYQQDYATDLIANDTLHFLRRSKRLYPHRPVFAVLSFPAPHGPEDVAPPYEHLFANASSHRTVAWNYAPNPDKQWLLQVTGKMEPLHVAFTNSLHRRRLQTLLSVDEAVERVFREMEAIGELRNTYFFYTSDHGYHLGQFGLLKGKSMPYEFDINVPFFARTPHAVPARSLDHPVLNIDLLPTFLDIAGMAVPDYVEGRSMRPLLDGNGTVDWRSSFLVERGANAAKLARVDKRLARQKARYERSMLVQQACARDEYSAPCRPFQKWQCRPDSVTGQMRVLKCRGRLSVRRDCVCFRQIEGKRRNSRSVDRGLRKRLTQYVASGAEKMAIAELEATHDEYYIGEVTMDELGSWMEEFVHDLNRKKQGAESTQKLLYESSRVKRQSQTQSEKSHPEAAAIDFLRQQWPLREDALQSARSCLLTRGSLACDNSNSGEDISRREEDDAFLTSSSFSSFLGTAAGEKKECVCGRRLEDLLNSLSNSTTRGSERHPARLSDSDTASDKRQSRRRKMRKLRRRGSAKRREKRLYCNKPSMHCFTHNNDHWKTPPLWTLGKLCFCQNANNNTYRCVRTVNATHDTLFCDYTTGFVSYYDLSTDPHQLQNTVHTLGMDEVRAYEDLVERLAHCTGYEECNRF